jgi:hypothetical protein
MMPSILHPQKGHGGKSANRFDPLCSQNPTMTRVEGVPDDIALKYVVMLECFRTLTRMDPVELGQWYFFFAEPRSTST